MESGKRNLEIAITGLLIASAVLFPSCNRSDIRLQEGDILFQDLLPDTFSNAIESVTCGAGDRNFSHCGLVVRKGDSLYVAEAIGKGVCLTPVDSFLARSGERPSRKVRGGTYVHGGMPSVAVGRLLPEYMEAVPHACKKAEGYLGRPYDFPFLPGDSALYCSELIYECFREYGIFHNSPMTFRRSGESSISEEWTEYYGKLGLPVPEGVPGTNPGALSRSEKLRIL